MGGCVSSTSEVTVKLKEDPAKLVNEMVRVPLGESTGHTLCHNVNPMKMRMNEKVPILIRNDFRRLFGVSSLIQYGHFIHYYMSYIIYQYTDYINYMKSGSVILRGLDDFCDIVISDDARYLFASTDNGWVITWDLDYHEKMRETKAHRSAIWTMACRNGLLATGGEDRKIHIWDVYTMIPMGSLPIQPEPVLQLDLNYSGDQLVSCSGGDRIYLFSLQTGECMRELVGHRACVNTARFVDSNHILSGSQSESVKLWNATTGENIRTSHNFDRVLNLSINCDRSLVACKTSLDTSILPYPWLMQASWISGINVCFHPLIPHLVAVQNSRSVSIVDVFAGEIVRFFERDSEHVSALCFTPDGSRLVTVSHNTIRIWETYDLAKYQ